MTTKTTTTNADGFDWDAPLDPRQQEQALLPKGMAAFSVLKLKRERKEFGTFGTQNIAVLELLVKSMQVPEEGEVEETEVRVQLALVNKLKWKIVQFFTAIGQRQPGDEGEFTPDWSKAEGADGICMIEHRTFKKKDKTDAIANEVSKFLAPGEEAPEGKPTFAF